MDVGRNNIENALLARCGLTARLLNQVSHGITLIQQTQLAVGRLLVVQSHCNDE